MARVFFFTLLSLVLAGLCSATPMDQQTLQTAVSDKWSWKDCGNPTDPVEIKSIEISPDPPKPGEDLTVTVIGEAKERIEEGAYADVTVKVGVIKILQKEFDLCEEARNAHADISCPVEKGTHKVVHTVTLPKEIPKAPFVVNVRGYTDLDDDMVCLDLNIDFRDTPTRKLFW
ncbi:hypothetical protein NM688_g134 [Phlebia brevispora]|uniref:Uncharacterized protein n=1 Tax=Phlebia brevispora TaxID=194682 RepID=A0ACC1TFE1_9APHY|nr:hypothetical protein NM688_g134 [Phlebia brevispora]